MDAKVHLRGISLTAVIAASSRSLMRLVQVSLRSLVTPGSSLSNWRSWWGIRTKRMRWGTRRTWRRWSQT